MQAPQLAHSTPELLSLVDGGWQRALSAVDALGEDRIDLPLLEDGWSAKDVLAHIRLYDAWLLGMLDVGRREEQAGYRSYQTTEEELNERNRVHRERDRTLPFAEVRRRALETHEALREELARVPEDRLSLPHGVREEGFAPAADGRALSFLIAIETYFHYRDHAEELEAARAR
jgi:Mycothiol maleylpyruvate isomerase N-terminal domain